MIIRENEPMALHTSFKAGGDTRYFIKVENLDELKESLDFARENGLPHFILGNGTNLLVSDSGFDGVIITLSGDFSNIETINPLKFKVGAAVPLGRFSRTTITQGIEGIHKLAGIPGTIGGAIYMNAGAYGQEIGTYCTQVTTLDAHGEIRNYPASQCEFGYRQSAFQKKPEETVLFAEFEFPPEAKTRTVGELEAELQECMTKRRATQPLNMPNAGSTFKRLKTGNGKTPEQVSPGYYIEQAGLKGLRIGGAEVSTLHANFIVNAGGATAKDIRTLAEYVQKKVFEKFGIRLELEIIILGK